MTAYNMTPYNTFIAKSRYSRYLDDKGRREHWDETVTRYFDFMSSHLATKCNYELTSELRNELQTARLRKNGIKEKIKPSFVSNTHKECLKCHSMYHIDNFPISKRGRLGRGPYCIECNKEYHKIRTESPEVKEKIRQSKLGLNNPAADKNIYTLKNKFTEDIINGTRFDLIEQMKKLNNGWIVPDDDTRVTSLLEKDIDMFSPSYEDKYRQEIIKKYSNN